MATDVSLGITIAFGTTAFSAEILDVTPFAMARDSIETSHQGTTPAKTFMPADLWDAGELSFGIHYEPDENPPIDGAVETITITMPDSTTLIGSGFFTAFNPTAPLNDKMTADVTVKWSGTITIDPQGAGSGSSSFEV